MSSCRELQDLGHVHRRLVQHRELKRHRVGLPRTGAPDHLIEQRHVCIAASSRVPVYPTCGGVDATEVAIGPIGL
jgi:hypothetical protein